MRLFDVDGQISYDLGEFCKDYGHPHGRSFTFKVACDVVTYVYADVVGMVRARKVFFDLSSEDLACIRKVRWMVAKPVPIL